MVCAIVARTGSFVRTGFRVDKRKSRWTISRKVKSRRAELQGRSIPMAHEAATRPLTMSEQADELEERMMHELSEKIATNSVLCNMGDSKVAIESGAALQAANPGKYFLMGADPRLPKMPDKPQLIDFFKQRFASTAHLLQSETHALKAGHNEKVILACLLHDIGVVSFIRCDHGYWGAQLIEPYVDEEVSWAICVTEGVRVFW